MNPDFTGEVRKGKGTWGKVEAQGMQLAWGEWFIVGRSEHGYTGLFSQREWLTMKLIKGN